LSGGALAGLLTAHAAPAAVKPMLIAAAAKSAMATGAVPSVVLQLSEGVMRMMLLSKLRAVTMGIVVSVALGTWFTAGALSAAPEELAAKQLATSKQPALPPPATKLSDLEFLKRICLDLRGSPATEVEASYFVADTDPNKRVKVVEWLLVDPTAKANHGNRININDNTFGWVEVLNASDRQVLAQWLGYSLKDVDRAAQIRRAYLDVYGVPPSAEVVRKYIGMKVPSASENQYFNRTVADPNPTVIWMDEWYDMGLGSDESFLRRAVLDARGTLPTTLEIEYFKADKDPKKRDKLLDLLLKDPEVAKKLGDGWKQRMRQGWAQPFIINQPYDTWWRSIGSRANKNIVWPPYYVPPTQATAPTDHFDKLLDQLLSEKRADGQVLDALSTATIGRLPTESERKLVLSGVSKQADKRTAWKEVIGTFTSTAEAKQHADELKKRSTPEKK
jgi:hypothetical protein